MTDTKETLEAARAAALEEIYCQWDDDNWNPLLSAIDKEDCILMLGPDASVVEDNGKPRPLTEILANKLAEKIKPGIKAHIDTSNLAQVSQYYVKERGTQSLISQAQVFYRDHQVFSPGFFQDLAALPFYFIITTTHDNLFFDALKNQNKHPQLGWYNFKNKKKQQDVEIGNRENPLVYYLYGHLHDENSLLLSESDMLDFLKALIEKPSLQDNIRTELKGKSFLFIGFGFRHWYLRLLLHVLQGCRNEKDPYSFALEQFIPLNNSESKETVFFFKNNDYNIHIFRKDFQQFAGALRQKFEQFPCTYKPKEAPEVFICYAHEDKIHADKLYGELKDEGIIPWLDDKLLEEGKEWKKPIEKTITQVDYFVVLLSKTLYEKTLNKKNKSYVVREIDMALHRQKKSRTGNRFILPVKIENCPIVEKLKELHIRNLTGVNDFSQLIKNIKRDFEKRKR